MCSQTNLLVTPDAVISTKMRQVMKCKENVHHKDSRMKRHNNDDKVAVRNKKFCQFQKQSVIQET